MPTIKVEMTDGLHRFVQDRVAQGGHQDARDYALSLVEADRRRDVRADLEAKLAVTDPAEPMSAADWEAVRQRGSDLTRSRVGRCRTSLPATSCGHQ